MAGNKRWTDRELEILKNKYGSVDVKSLSEELGRSVDSIHWKASKLNIEFHKNDIILLQRSIANIEKKIDQLFNYITSNLNFDSGYTKWTKENISILKDNQHLSAKELSKLIGVSENSILSKKAQLKLRKKKTSLDQNDKEYILKNYEKATMRKISNDLSVPYHRVIAFVKENIKNEKTT